MSRRKRTKVSSSLPDQIIKGEDFQQKLTDNSSKNSNQNTDSINNNAGRRSVAISSIRPTSNAGYGRD